MAEKLINITAPQYRCGPIASSCPAVYRSEDGKTFTIIGTRVVSQIADKAGPGEEAVEISAEILLSSLGIEQLVKASNAIIRELEMHERFWKEFPNPDANRAFIKVPTEIARALREALSSIKGGK